MKNYLKLAKVHHYIKNILVVFPLFFSGRLGDTALLLRCVYAFLAFSFLSSVVYIINDIKDAPEDRLHEKKKERPIASGAVSVRSGYIFAGVLFVLSAVAAYLASGRSVWGYFYLAIYLFVNIFYSFKGKTIPILDIILLVSGFLIRVLYGAQITGIAISDWLYLTVMSISFYFGLGKRRNELKRNPNSARKVLKSYNYNFLDKMMYMFMAIAVVFYSLWCVFASSAEHIIWSVPIVATICMRYSLIAEGDSDGDPVEVIVHDKALIVLGFFFFAALFVLIYF